MGNKKIIAIIDEKKERQEVEVLCSFKLNENNKNYVIFTKNEIDENGNVTIYAYELIKEKNELAPISEDIEWTKLKEIIRNMSKSSEESGK